MAFITSPDRSTLPIAMRDALGACRGAFVAMFVFSVAINLLVLASPLYMMQLYDRVLNSRSMDTLLLLTIITIGAMIVMAALELVRGRLMVRVSGWLDARLSGEALIADIVATLNRSASPSAQGLRDLAGFRAFLTGPGMFPILDAPWVPLFLLVIFMLHPLLGFLALAGALLLFSLALLNERLSSGPLNAAGKAAREVQDIADMNVRNADVIEAMGMMPNLVERWRAANAESFAFQAKASDRAVAITAVSKFVRLALQSLMLGAGAYLVIEREATGGVMIGASIILGRALAPVEQAIGSWRNIVSARQSYRRLRELLAATPPRGLRTSLPPPKGRLRVENVIFAPPGVREPVIKNVSFELNAGEMLALIGPSASGKTTLARLMVGTWRPQRGQVRLDGASLAAWEPDERGQHVGYLPQDIELFAGTVRDNIARMGKGDDAAVIEAARSAAVHEMILGLLDGYDTEIGSGGMWLSGGQRQRIGLARALYGAPPLIVLDEPNANLDNSAEERLVQTLAELKGQATVVLITHRLNLLNLADKVLLLRDGTVEAFGPRAEVMSKLTRPARPMPRALQPSAAAPSGDPAEGFPPQSQGQRS
jgi:PrtD family type I secretion system ABC transporter